MSNNYDDYGYEDSNKESSGLGRKILVIILVLVAIILIVFLLKKCTGNTEEKPKTEFNYETALLDAGKLFYENNIDLYPTEAGECGQVELETLIEKGLVASDKFSACNTSTTYVKVCKLENGSMHYVPWLTCTDKNSESEYDEFKEGTLADLVTDSSMIKFEFLPQALKTGGTTLGKVEELWKSDIKYTAYKTLSTTTNYRYKDLLYIWNIEVNKKYYTSSGEKSSAKDVNEYYKTSPSSEYNLHDSQATAYKWFTTDSTKTYYMKNGAKAYSATPVEGYPYNEGGVIVTMYQTRTITETFDAKLYHECRPTKNSTTVKYQQLACGSGDDPDYKVETNSFYSCASSSSDSVIGNKVEKGTTCKKYSNWSAATNKACTVGELCRSASATFYYWYKLEDSGVKKYYPSGSTSASGEKVYYTSAPVEGASRDESTKDTVYKWYKATSAQSSDYSAVAPSEGATKIEENSKWSSWSSWSTKNPKVNDGRTRKIESKEKIKLQQILGTTEDSWEDLSDKYVTEEEMINIFKSKNYNVNSLKDINNNGELKYKIKMYIRNKKSNL